MLIKVVTRMIRTFSLQFILIWVFLVRIAYGQVTDLSSAINSGMSFIAQYWKANNDEAHQFALPITFQYAPTDRLLLQMTSTPSFSGIKTGGTAQLGGLSDTRLNGSYELVEERVLLTFGLNLPSGKSALTAEEFSVASILAIHAMNFQVPILGQGFDASGGLVMVQRAAGFVIGSGIGYLMRGVYTPYVDVPFKYNPGDELTFSLGFDRPIGRDKGIMIDASYTLYGTDYANDVGVFKAGNRAIVQGLAYYQGELFGLIFKIRDRFQSPNKMGSGDLVLERKNSNGNEFELSTTGTLALNRKMRVHGVIESRIYSNNDYDIGGAIVSGLGGGFSRWLSESIKFNLDGRFYFGSMNVGTENVSLTGLVLSGGIKIVL